MIDLALLSQVAIGLYRGSFYWLLAAGLTLIFGVTRIVNFAHAAFFVLGGYLMYTFYVLTGSFLLSLIASLTVTGLLGALTEVTLIRRIYEVPPIYQLLLTFGVTLVVNDVQKLVWGKFPKYIDVPEYFKGSIQLGAISYSYYSLLVVVLGFLVFLLLHLIINKTIWGLRVRAVWRDPSVAQTLRINPRKLYTTIFLIGTALAGLGGSLIIVLHPVGPGLGDYLIVYAFIVVVMAGLGNIVGAFIVSLLIGVLSSVFTWLIPEADILLIYLIAAVCLLLRVGGLFGER
jgi:branched-subunit amino acid ABC-type transport system permease component